ncbi:MULTISPECIES: hypothetical protein [unclassified Microcoleus]|uniref:hypothetical protein n=1 Tax=unclassified Microcoleus TaxID=2642155 RepID=UPI002FD39D6F
MACSRSAIAVDRPKTLLGKRGGEIGAKYILAQDCCLGTIEKIPTELGVSGARQSVAGRWVCRSPPDERGAPQASNQVNYSPQVAQMAAQSFLGSIPIW